MVAENWCMEVQGRIYGPYTTEKMADLAGQKRLAYHSLVAPAGSRTFRPALQYNELRPIFGGVPKAAPSAEAGGRCHLILFGDPSSATEKASELLSRLPEARALTGTSYLVKTTLSADEIRDQLASVLPNTERAIVLTLSGAEVASHGVGLTEHEDVRVLLAG